MKTSLLKSVALLGFTATLFAIMAAFTTEHPRRLSDQLTEENASPTLQNWVMSQLGYPSILEREEKNNPVLLRLHIGPTGLVEVLTCSSAIAALEPYVIDRLQGKSAMVRNDFLSRDFEMKINFRPMEGGHGTN